MDHIAHLRALAAKARDLAPGERPTSDQIAANHAADLLAPADAAARLLMASFRLTVRDFIEGQGIDRGILCAVLAESFGKDARLDEPAWTRLADEGELPGA